MSNPEQNETEENIPNCKVVMVGETGNNNNIHIL